MSLNTWPTQLAQLARQARQAARYREIGEELAARGGVAALSAVEGSASRACLTNRMSKRERTCCTRRPKRPRGEATKLRQQREDALPALREEEAIAAAVLQRLSVQRDTLDDQEARGARIETLSKRGSGSWRADMEREGALNRDAGETIARLEWEARELTKAGRGHEARLDASRRRRRVRLRRSCRRVRMHCLSLTEDVARLAARHQSAQRSARRQSQDRSPLQRRGRKSQARCGRSSGAFGKSGVDFEAAQQAESAATKRCAGLRRTRLNAAEASAGRHAIPRGGCAGRTLSEADGEVNALSR